MTLRGTVALAAAIWTLALVPGAAGAASDRPVTVVGDSVQASFEYVPAAVRRLGRGLTVRLDAKVCRRLEAPSCPYKGATPLTAIELIRASGSALGHTVVVNVGYNDDPRAYDVGAVMRALRAAKVEAVVWVTLHESRSVYAATNARIRAAARHWPEMMRIAEWNAVSLGRPWFGSDGLHLNAKGAMALSGLLRKEVLATFPV